MKVKGRSILKQKIIPIASQILLALVNIYCLLIYFTGVTDKDLLNLGYVGYMIMCTHGVIGLTKFYNEDMFLDLSILLDYAQIVLPLPFLTTALWQKLEVGPNEIALVHCSFGLAAFLFFAIMEYKRQDLTDLALMTSIISSIIVGILNGNFFASGAGFLAGGAYFALKRGHDDCGVQPSTLQGGLYNVVMSAFSVLTLAQFEPKSWIPEF